MTDALEELRKTTDSSVFANLLKFYAKKIGCTVNDDVVNSLNDMLLKFGKFYCPCRPIEIMSEEKRQVFVCPCVPHLKEIKTKGSCHCKLFVKN